MSLEVNGVGLEIEAIEHLIGRRPSNEELAEKLAISPRKLDVILRGLNDPIPFFEPDADGKIPAESTEINQHPDPFDVVAAKELRQKLDAIIKQLKPKTRQILRMRFGFDGKDDFTLDDIGQQFELTRERIRQIETKALRQLKPIAFASQLEFWIDKHKSPSASKKGAIDDYKTHSKVELDNSLFHEEVKIQSPPASKAIIETIDSNIAAAIDGLIVSAKKLGVPVDDSRKNGLGLILFELTDKPENKNMWPGGMAVHANGKIMSLVEALLFNGFQYWPGKGYWR